MRRWVAVFGTRRSRRRRSPLFRLRPAALVGVDGRHLAHPWHGAAHRHRRAYRPGRTAGRVHAVAHPPARVRHPDARADPADLVDRAACTGRWLFVGAAVSEIWLSLDSAGQWLFGIYGAAAAVALLGVLAFYLAVRRRTAAATTQTAEGQAAQSPPRSQEGRSCPRRRGGRRRHRRGRADDPRSPGSETSEDSEATEDI